MAWRGEAAWRVTLIRTDTTLDHNQKAENKRDWDITGKSDTFMAWRWPWRWRCIGVGVGVDVALTWRGEGWRGVAAWRGVAWRGVAWQVTLIRTDTTLDHSQKAEKKRDWDITGKDDQQHAQVKEPGF